MGGQNYIKFQMILQFDIFSVETIKFGETGFSYRAEIPVKFLISL